MFLPSIISRQTAKAYRFMGNSFNQLKAPYYFQSSVKEHIQQSEKLSHGIQKAEKIKLWSLEGLLSKCIDEHLRNTNSSESQLQKNEQITAMKNYLKKNSPKSSSNQLHIVVNRYFNTIQGLPNSIKNKQQLSSFHQQDLRLNGLYSTLLKIVQQSPQWSFLPHYHNIVKRHSQAFFPGLYLLIGDYNDSITSHYPSSSYITLEELCAMYPQKIPLSYRSRQTVEMIRQKVQARINRGKTKENMISLKQEPKISQILIINDRIKMWDQAIQVMLDYLPVKITVPFHIAEPSLKFYRLNLKDFIRGFQTSHRIIHPNIKLEIQQQNIQDFITEAVKGVGKQRANSKRLQVELMDQQLSQGKSQRFQIVI